MPRFNPRYGDPADDFDLIDDIDDLGDIEDYDPPRGPSRNRRPAPARTFPPDYPPERTSGRSRRAPSEWDDFPDMRRRDSDLRTSPARPSRGDRYPEEPQRQPRREFSEPPEPRSARRRGVGFGAIFLLLMLLAAGAAVYVYFFTDLYYVAGVKMEQTYVSLFVGENTALDHEVTSFGSGTPVLEWSSTDPAVAGVDEQGSVTALSAGSTTVTLLDPPSGRMAQCIVSVHDVSEMVLDADSFIMGMGQTQQLSVQTAAQSTETPVYVSSDSDIAAVDESGVITALSAGETDITVSMRGFSDVSCHVKVMMAPSDLMTSTSGALCAGETRQIVVELNELEYCSEYKFESEDPDIASVDENGVLTGNKEGETTLTITAYNGQRLNMGVTVSAEPDKVTVPKKLTVYSGQPQSLEASDNTGSCRQFFYTTSDPEVIQVDESGNIHVLRQGTATVTCTSYNGKSAKCQVTAKIVDWTTPYTSDAVYENIAALAATYPELITTESIGKSVQGKDITLLKLGTGERKVLVVAGMHAREGIAVTHTMRCIDEYAQAAADSKRYGKYNVKKLLSEYTVYFVPLLNPDGMDIFMGLGQPEYTDQPLTEEELAEFKNTASGVNLNSNFPFEWGYEGINVTTPDGRTYAGTAAGSEPETQAIMKLCAENEFEWLLDMHCRGHLIYYQDKVTGIVGDSDKMARRLYSRCGFTLTDQSTRFEISGGLENWFRKEYDRPGICVELVENRFNTEVNKHFERKTAWEDTRYVFLICMED